LLPFRLMELMAEPLFEMTDAGLCSSCNILGLVRLLAAVVHCCPEAALPALTSAMDSSSMMLENIMAALQLPHAQVQEALIR
jgi:hypothetical protein